MKFARIVFTIAGIWGVLVLAPLYFMFDLIGEKDPPPITHPAFFYGFVGTALAWQAVFLLIARDPLRLRALMLPSVLEKLAYGIPVFVLFAQGRIASQDLVFGGADLIFATLFVASWLRTASARTG
jgi:hypothetical protein